MPVPLCNVVIECEGRRARVDHLWPELGVVGECDGKLKYESPNDVGEVIWQEKRRHEWLQDLGLEVARWGYTEVAGDGALMEARYLRAVQRQQRQHVEQADEGDGPGADVGAEPGTLSGDAFGAFLRSEVDKWGEVVKTSGAKVD